MKLCTIIDCSKRSQSSIGYCAFHMYRYKNNIPLDKPYIQKTPIKDIKEKRARNREACFRYRETEKYQEFREKTFEHHKKQCKEYREVHSDRLKEVDRQYYVDNIDKILADKKIYREENREYIQSWLMNWRKNNKDKIRELNQTYYKSNYGRIVFHVLKRQNVISQAFLFHHLTDDINEVYQGCPDDKQVDHIIPLQGKNVTGLHVPWNFQYLTPEENRFKSNRFDSTYDNTEWKELFNKFK